MNIDHLRYLIAISKEKKMSDAAEKLFVTPQALTMAMKKLEVDLDMPLLYRFPSGTVLTENGKWLADRAEIFLDDIEQRKLRYHNYINANDIKPVGEIELALNSLGINAIKLADMICEITLKYPQFKIKVEEKSREKVEEDVLNEKIELGFIYRTKVNDRFIDTIDDGLSFYPLQMGELVIQATNQTQLNKSKGISLSKIAGYKYCIYNIYREDRVQALLKIVTGVDIDCLNTNSFSVYKSNVESGQYITVSIKMVGDEQCTNHLSHTTTYAIRDDIMVYFGVIRKKDSSMSNNSFFLWSEILKVYNGILHI